MAVVSVVFPVFNGQPYLIGALESLFSQTLSDFEIVAIDDGSTDQSLAILSRFARRDCRLRVIMRKNTGIETALNEGIDAARSEFIARMDSDDVACPDRLQNQLAMRSSMHPLILFGRDSSLYAMRIRVTPGSVARIRCSWWLWSITLPM